MAKKEETKAPVVKPVEIRPQTDEEIRKRLKHQGKIKDAPKQKDEGVVQLTEEQALENIEDRKERKENELTEEDPNVRPMTKKDVVKRLSAQKERDKKKEKDDKKKSRLQTDADIKARNNPDEDEDGKPKTEKELEKGSEVPELYPGDVVSFKDDDGKKVTGEVIEVLENGEVVVDTEDSEYTVPGDIVSKEEKKKEEK